MFVNYLYLLSGRIAEKLKKFNFSMDRFWTVFEQITWTRDPFTWYMYEANEFWRTKEIKPFRTDPCKKTGVDIRLFKLKR